MVSEAPTPMKLVQNKDGNQMPHQLIDTTDFHSLAAIIFQFLKNMCLRTMECLHCELKAFFQIVHIYMHKVVKGLSKKSFDNFL